MYLALFRSAAQIRNRWVVATMAATTPRARSRAMLVKCLSLLGFSREAGLVRSATSASAMLTQCPPEAMSVSRPHGAERMTWDRSEKVSPCRTHGAARRWQVRHGQLACPPQRPHSPVHGGDLRAGLSAPPAAGRKGRRHWPHWAIPAPAVCSTSSKRQDANPGHPL